MLYQLKLRQENRNWARYSKQEGPYNRDWALTGVTLHQASFPQTEKLPVGYPVGAQACLGCRPGTWLGACER